MPRTLKTGLIQLSLPDLSPTASMRETVDEMTAKHIPFIQEAGRRGVQVLCLQEIFSTPYFCPSQDASWYETAEPVPGPTTERLAELAREFQMAIVAPIYEKEAPGILYNTAAVLDADGAYLGKYRKTHIPHTSGFWEKFFFRPGNLGYPVFQTAYAKVGVYICYDRHFPEGARALGLNGAEVVYNPSATVKGLSGHLWELEQPAHAAANGYFMGCVNRVGVEAPWNLGEFYGRSYFVNPRGEIIAQAAEGRDEILVAELELDLIDEVRSTWQFYRDRRPDSYGNLVAP
ncbi:MAG: acyltransferase [Gammaproteobacteria bacterium]|nr:acyltransferase [Gammaproteobacteria bacterium]MXY06901.1 acyltransferase [Gammaproteobacteria bacterium]MYE50803.1 acyltransferase [Gammaproteobacteria bacterium]MYE86493.1 acyltransferase [Gammaproteobacteria bacterium]MYG11559.1 acyltransferase [Gammaproteobacteria bacterium]